MYLQMEMPHDKDTYTFLDSVELLTMSKITLDYPYNTCQSALDSSAVVQKINLGEGY